MHDGIGYSTCPDRVDIDCLDLAVMKSERRYIAVVGEATPFLALFGAYFFNLEKRVEALGITIGPQAEILDDSLLPAVP